jgi:hypothetical protein
MAWISVVVRLAVTSTVVWLTIIVYFGRPDTLQYMLVEAGLFSIQSASRRTNVLVTKPEHKVTFVVRSHPDLELDFLTCLELCKWSLIIRQELSVAARGHGQVRGAQTMRTEIVNFTPTGATAHGRVEDKRMPIGERGKQAEECHESHHCSPCVN